MGRILLVGHPDFTWREWLKDNQRDWVNLDPKDADHGPPCRAFWMSGGKVRSWRMTGSPDPARNPIGVLTAAWSLSLLAPEDSVFQLFAVRNTPLLRQLALDTAQALSPSEVLVPKGSGLATIGWPMGAHEVEIPGTFPPMVLEAQRRARWLDVLENSEDHEVHLKDVTTLGSRLGSGDKVKLSEWEGWCEVSGGVLHLVGDHEPTNEQASAMLDHSHTSRLSLISPHEYKGLVCSFSSESGEDFGIGVIQEFIPEREMLRIRCTAVAPAPVRLLRIGTLRIDGSGRETDEIKPWSL